MKGFASEKVVGGKLIRVKTEYGKTLKNIEITGDFFIHPEESLEEIEKNLVGLNVNVAEPVLFWHVKKIVDDKNIELVGVTPEVIARVVKQAMK